MLRAKSLLLFISSILIIISCSETTTDPGESSEEEESIEPTVSVNNPSDGESLEGEITLAIDGESENGFDEARIFVGDEQVEAVESPSLPHEQTVATYNYDNGDYDLRAELDPTGQDTTVEASVSVTLENYMVTLETDGYVEYLNEYSDAGYLFISDPSGKVLREVELTAQSDGEFKLLPPSELEEGAPDNFSVTIARTSTYNNQQSLSLETNIGIEPWSRIYKEGSVSPNEEFLTTEMTVRLHNHKNDPNFVAVSEGHNNIVWGLQRRHMSDGVTKRTVDFREDTEQAMITSYPSNTDGSVVPQFYWEKNVQDSIGTSDSLRYDVTEKFQPLDQHDVTIPSDLTVQFHYRTMSVEPNSWEEGSFLFYNFGGGLDGNTSDTELGMFLPKMSDHLYSTYISAYSSDEDVGYEQAISGELPSEFTKLDAHIDITNRSMDNLQLSAEGSFDMANLQLNYNSEEYSQSWNVTLPDTATKFVFPQIADSLDQSVDYNRSNFQFSNIGMYDYKELDGFSDYLNSVYGVEQTGQGDSYIRKSINLSESSKVKVAPVRSDKKIYKDKNKIEEIHIRGSSDRSPLIQK